MTATTFDADAARAFIELLWPPEHRLTGHLHACMTGAWSGRHYPDRDGVVAYAEQADRAGAQGVYLRATTVRADLPSTERGKRDDARDFSGLFADLDIAGPGHKGENLPPDEDAARAIVAKSGLPEPTLWVHSGGGLVPWWLLAAPIPLPDQAARDRVTALGKAWEARLLGASAALGWHMDSTAELARVMRLPGSVNRKVDGDPRPCRVLSSDGPRYALEEMEAVLAAVPTPEVPRPASEAHAAGGDAFAAPSGGTDRPWPERDPYTLAQAKRMCANKIAELEECRHELNRALNSAAMLCGHFVPAFFTEESVRARLLAAQTKAWSAMTGKDDDGDHAEALGTIASGLAAGMAKPARRADPAAEDAAASDAPGEANRRAMRTGQRGPDSADGTPGRVRIHVGGDHQAAAADFLRDEIGRGALAGLLRGGSVLQHTPRVGESGYVPPADELDSDGPAQVRPVSVAEFRALVEVRYDVGVVRETEDEGTGKKTFRWVRSQMPRAVAESAFNSVANGDTPNLRELRGVTHTPLLRPDGSILERPGYDQATRVLYLPTAYGLAGFEVPAEPTPEQVAAAVELILRPIAEFPFVTENDRANWVGAAFTPLLRPLLPPPYPMVVFDATMPGAGKGFLQRLLHDLHGGVLRSDMPGDGAEMEKLMMSLLLTTTAPVVSFDNIRGTVRSAYLEGALTEQWLTGRVLGVSKSPTVHNDRLWTMTSNNATIGGDLARRTLWVRIDPGAPNPEGRRFALDLNGWMARHRADYLRAMLTVARAWVVAGQPMGESAHDNYARWRAGVRGLLSFAGFPGEFAATETGATKQSAEDDEWGDFLAAVADSYGYGQEWTAAEMAARLTGSGLTVAVASIDAALLPDDLAAKHDDAARFGRMNGFSRSLGKALGYREGRYFSGLTVTSRKATSGPRKNLTLWAVVPPGYERAPATVTELPVFGAAASG